MRVPPVERIPIVGVMGSAASAPVDACADLGRWIAVNGWHLLTGGGGGVMEAVSRGFTAVRPRKGSCLGILPGDVSGDEYRRDPSYPNDYVEIPIVTHLPSTGMYGLRTASRNHINILTSTVVVLLPGGLGTLSEALLAVRYRKPAVAVTLGAEAAWPVPLPPELPRASWEEAKAFVFAALSNKVSTHPLPGDHWFLGSWDVPTCLAAPDFAGERGPTFSAKPEVFP